MSKIQCTSVTRMFGSFTAVDAVSFSLSSGKIVGLLGANGAGKTTTLRLLAGELLPSSGSVVFDSLSSVKASRGYQRQVGFLPESNPLYQELLVVELFEYTRDLYQIPQAVYAAQLQWVVPSLGLSSVYTTPIKQLSKGYRQRVGLAAAILHDPPVLLLDEPTEGLDPIQRQQLHAVLRQLAQKKIVVLSTHLLQEAQQLCDRVLVLDRGVLVADSDEAHSQTTEPTVLAELEGKHIIKLLRTSPLELVSSQRIGHSRYLVTLRRGQAQTSVQEYVSKLVTAQNWTVWSLSVTSLDSLETFYTQAIQSQKVAHKP